jgi:hypothetical protein
MHSISNKIILGKKALIAKNYFINDEIIPSAVVKFTCNHCNHVNTVEITPYESGFRFSRSIMKIKYWLKLSF